MLLLIVASGCEDFLDVNDDPTKVQEGQINLSALLPTVIEATSESHYSAIFSASRATHQVDHVSGYYSEFTMDANWSRIYLETLNTLDIIVDKAEEEGSPYYVGIARVLQALNLGLLTDTWEDAPMAEALQGSENITPVYDSQEEIYAKIIDYLDDAIIYLTEDESFNVPGSDDMVYGGNLGKWERLAYTLKARYMLHLYGKGTYSSIDILSAAEKGFSSNDDNLMLFYNSVNLNPLHSGVALANETGNLTITHGKYLVDLMNGTTYPLFDPRLPIIADTTGSGGSTYEGLASYDSGTPAHTCEITRYTWYATEDAPILMASYAELKFIEAEVALTADVAAANSAYLAGIEAHMDMLGVDGADKSAYLSDPSVALGGTPDLEHIMKEKYIALFLNFEAWNDMRRYGYDTDIYKGFVVPEFDGRTEPGQRALYPTSEQNRNATNLSGHIREFTEAMWKDVN
jgi:hypothetical protein